MDGDSGLAGGRTRSLALLCLWVTLASLAAVGVLLASQEERGFAAPAAANSRKTLHYAANMAEDERSRAAELGFNLFDTGPDPEEIDSLKDGQRALVWVGAGFEDCEPETSWSEFKKAVDALAGNSKVYGWYLFDEPNLKECSGLLKEIRRRADYIKEHAPEQKSFVVALDGGGPDITPDRSHVDLIGLDPYPCEVDKDCEYRLIDRLVSHAKESGIPTSAIVPVFQTFGQSCNGGEHKWRLPTAAELRTILARWDKLVPTPAFDYAYSWANQREWSCPTLADANGTKKVPNLQSVMKKHNRSGKKPPPSASSTTSTTEGKATTSTTDEDSSTTSTTEEDSSTTTSTTGESSTTTTMEESSTTSTTEGDSSSTTSTTEAAPSTTEGSTTTTAAPCQPTTTMEAPTTTVPSSTTEAPSSTRPEHTRHTKPSRIPSTLPADTGNESTVLVDHRVSQDQGVLPFTGLGGMLPMLLGGAALLGSGAVLLGTSRRRSHPDRREPRW
jgi:hypothetical protein